MQDLQWEYGPLLLLYRKAFPWDHAPGALLVGVNAVGLVQCRVAGDAPRRIGRPRR